MAAAIAGSAELTVVETRLTALPGNVAAAAVRAAAEVVAVGAAVARAVAAVVDAVTAVGAAVARAVAAVVAGWVGAVAAA